MPLYKSQIFFILLLVASSSIFTFRYSIFLFLKYMLLLCLTLFRLFALLWLGSCTHFILACFLGSKKLQCSLSNHGLCWFSSFTPTLSLAEVLLFSLMFSQPLFMSLLSHKFSKAAKLFEILILCCFLSSLFSFHKLNLTPSNFYTAFLLSVKFSLTFANTR